jgi:hypothetical protein
VADDQPPRGLNLWIQLKPREDVLHDAHVVLRLLEVLLPFLLEVVVHGAAERGLVDLHATQLGLEGLVEQLVGFFMFPGISPRSSESRRRPRPNSPRRAMSASTRGGGPSVRGSMSRRSGGMGRPASASLGTLDRRSTGAF